MSPRSSSGRSGWTRYLVAQPISWRGQNRSALHIGGAGKWEAKLKRDATAQAPAGGVSSSARDLSNWMRLELANGKFDGKQLIGEAHLPPPMCR